MEISIILAVATNGVIGKDNALAWRLKYDLQYFKKLTTQQTVIMGRKTYESIGRPLPNRENIVVTRDPNKQIAGCTVAHSLQEAIAIGKQLGRDIFIIGGAEIYKQAIPYIDKAYRTRVIANPEGDAYFDNSMLQGFTTIQSDFKPMDPENEFDAYYETLLKT